MAKYYKVLYKLNRPNSSRPYYIGRWTNFSSAVRYANRWCLTMTQNVQILQMYGKSSVPSDEDSITYIYERNSAGEFVINYNAKLISEEAQT